MKSKRRLATIIAVTAVALTLAACGAQANEVPNQIESTPVPIVPTEPPPTATSEPTLDWVTLPEGICQDIEVTVAGTLGVTDIGLETDAPFEDYVGGTSGRGCLILVGGTGADFAGVFDVFMQLENMLVNIGWTRDPQYAADGPTGMGGGFRRDAGLLLVMVGWEPSSDANCPEDQPISACSLTPEQQIYTITLSIAMK